MDDTNPFGEDKDGKGLGVDPQDAVDKDPVDKVDKVNEETKTNVSTPPADNNNDRFATVEAKSEVFRFLMDNPEYRDYESVLVDSAKSRLVNGEKLDFDRVIRDSLTIDQITSVANGQRAKAEEEANNSFVPTSVPQSLQGRSTISAWDLSKEEFEQTRREIVRRSLDRQ